MEGTVTAITVLELVVLLCFGLFLIHSIFRVSLARQ